MHWCREMVKQCIDEGANALVKGDGGAEQNNGLVKGDGGAEQSNALVKGV